MVLAVWLDAKTHVAIDVYEVVMSLVECMEQHMQAQQGVWTSGR